jgi:hypothetical protein
MVKAFILAQRNHKKIKIFVKDIHKLCMAAKRKIPAIPAFQDPLSPYLDPKAELSGSEGTEHE